MLAVSLGSIVPLPLESVMGNISLGEMPSKAIAPRLGV